LNFAGVNFLGVMSVLLATTTLLSRKSSKGQTNRERNSLTSKRTPVRPFFFKSKISTTNKQTLRIPLSQLTSILKPEYH
jgi:hypothetical protein